MSGEAWIVTVVLVVLAVIGLDRLVASGRFDRRTSRRAGPSGGTSAATGAFGDLVEIFQPNRVHLTEELERQRLETDQVGDSAPPIDLDSGVVHLPARTVSPRPDEDGPGGVDGSGQIPAPGSTTDSPTDAGADEAKPTTNPPGAST
ncbi:DUF6191 domain-containing protein [Cellulomonas soli]|uniref:DUF6191 domain-containing protein n=1 Tax=Cellulomonas soli TaxID=931535 RepID=UPI003F868C9E